MNDNSAWPLRKSLLAAKGYQSSYAPRTPDEVKLNHNEAPRDVDPAIKTQVLAKIAQLPWHRYSDADGGVLRHALATHYGLAANALTVGHGANDLLHRLIAALDPSTTLHVLEPDYYVYSRAAAVLGVPVVRHPLVRHGTRFLLPIEQLLAIRGPATLLLSQPNNPTGGLLDQTQIHQLITQFHGLVVLDEAYAEFAGTSRLADLPQHPNLLILRTMSKAYALAGVRVGWLAGDPHLIAELDKLQPPYPLGVLTTVAAEVSLQHPEIATSRVTEVCAERDRMVATLCQLGVWTAETHASFVLCDFAADRPAVLRALTKAALAVRDIGQLLDLTGVIRISVGDRAANDRALAAIQSALQACP